MLLTFIEAYFNRLSGELLLALKVATVRAEALLSPEVHVEHSPLDHADMGVVELIEDALRLLGIKSNLLLLSREVVYSVHY